MVWLTISWITIFLAYFQLGHFPVYGHDPDPTELGFEKITFIAFFIFLIGFVTVFLWPVILLLSFTIKGRKYKVDYISLAVFVGSIILFFYYRYFFPAQFLWLND